MRFDNYGTPKTPSGHPIVEVGNTSLATVSPARRHATVKKDLAKSASATLELTMASTLTSFIVDCGTKAQFENCDVAISWSADGLSFYTDDAHQPQPSPSGRYFCSVNAAHRAVRLSVTSNNDATILLFAAVSNHRSALEHFFLT